MQNSQWHLRTKPWLWELHLACANHGWDGVSGPLSTDLQRIWAITALAWLSTLQVPELHHDVSGRQRHVHLWACQPLLSRGGVQSLVARNLGFQTHFRKHGGLSIAFMEQQPVLQALKGICQRQRAVSKPFGNEKGNGPQHLACFPLWCRNI